MANEPGHATTPDGRLKDLLDCYIKIPGYTRNSALGQGYIVLRILPEIQDSKSAAYNDETILGRSIPLKTFSHGENRQITMNCPFMVAEEDDIRRNLSDLKALESAVYPRIDDTGGNPFLPPPVCEIKCGSLLASSSSGEGESVCAVLKSYSVSFPQDVPWDQTYYLPYKFNVNLTWEVVYTTQELPGQEKILISGGAK